MSNLADRPETPKQNQDQIAEELATTPEEQARIRMNRMAGDAAGKASKTEQRHDNARNIFPK
jgi:hypothetical protein